MITREDWLATPWSAMDAGVAVIIAGLATVATGTLSSAATAPCDASATMQAHPAPIRRDRRPLIPFVPYTYVTRCPDMGSGGDKRNFDAPRRGRTGG